MYLFRYLMMFFATMTLCHAETIVVLETTQGNIEISLKPTIAPKACENFLGLIDKGYYAGTVFHRVIKGFMNQGGCPKGDGTGG